MQIQKRTKARHRPAGAHNLYTFRPNRRLVTVTTHAHAHQHTNNRSRPIKPERLALFCFRLATVWSSGRTFAAQWHTCVALGRSTTACVWGRMRRWRHHEPPCHQANPSALADGVGRSGDGATHESNDGGRVSVGRERKELQELLARLTHCGPIVGATCWLACMVCSWRSSRTRVPRVLWEPKKYWG